MSTSKSFLIAGGAGFIGSHLCERLLTNGKKVICVDNLITGSKRNIEKFLHLPNFVFIEKDVIKGVADVKDELYGIFHLASPASPNKRSPRSYINHPIETLLVNSLGTYHLLELARRKQVRFVYASSSEVYGNPDISPQDETYVGHVNPIGVRSMYDEGKRFGESMAMAYFRKYSLDARIVRIFNTYGEKMQKDDGRAVANFINQAILGDPITIYGDGTQTRSFCYVDDMVDGLIQTMDIDSQAGLVVNLGNPDEHTIIDIATFVKKLSNSKSNIIFEELPEDDPLRRKPN